MKYISFVVPCYNSEEYMEKCIESLLIGKDDVEIIIIDDGSKDNTGKIADRYQKKYPKIVKVVHQENGGHGEGINTGLKHATGKYFKVVDSDDWLDEEAYKKLLKEIKHIDTDLVVCNYVYTYTDGRSDHTISFANVYEEGKVLTWDDIHKFKVTQYPSLHSMMYKKSVYDLTEIENKKLRKLMTRECIFLMTIGVIFSRLAFNKEGEKQYKELWKIVKEKNPKLYRRMRYFSMATWVSIPGTVGRWIMKLGYRFAHSLVNFN